MGPHDNAPCEAPPCTAAPATALYSPEARCRFAGAPIVAWMTGRARRPETTEGGHHARVARFLRDHHVEAVAASHMGQPMVHTIERLGIAVHLGVTGDARQAAIAAGPATA